MKEMYLEKGFADYLSKPILPDKLEKILTKHLPADKRIIISEEECNDALLFEEQQNLNAPSNIDNQSDKTTQNPLHKLKELITDVDLDRAIIYCFGNEDMYMELLKDFAQNGRYERILKAYQDLDLKLYAIEVHTLKSTSKTLGFDKLAELADHLQYVAEQNDINSIHNNHDGMMNVYKEILSTIKQFCMGE